MKTFGFWFYLSTLCVIAVGKTSGSKILFSAMPDSDSHRRSMYPLAEALAGKGHHVVMFSEIGQATSARGKNVTDNLILLNVPAEHYDQDEKIMNGILWYKKSMTPLDIIFPWKRAANMAGKLFEENMDAYRKVLLSEWDLIVVDALFTISGATLVTQSKVPYVLYDPSLVTSVETACRSVPFPAASFPPMFLSTPTFDNARFTERLFASVSYGLDILAFTVVDRLLYRPTIVGVLPTASLWDFYSRAEASLVDYPIALDFPRPTTPDLFYVGGKCKSATLTDSDLLAFVDDPTSLGTVVIAFGHLVKWKDAPARAKMEFAHALNRLDRYRVVWQFDGEPPVEMKSHVRRMTWLPQTELLNHAATKLFVSHGGLKSIMESICGQVPAVMIPFFAEQVRNAYLYIRQGAGENLNKFELTNDNIYETFTKVLNGQRYKDAVKRLKWSVVDRAPVTPMENGLFWTEYMIRHKGLPRKWFRNKGVGMGWIRYFALDVIGLFSLVIISLTYFVIFAIKKVVKC